MIKSINGIEYGSQGERHGQLGCEFFGSAQSVGVLVDCFEREAKLFISDNRVLTSFGGEDVLGS